MFRLSMVFLVIVLIAAGAADYAWRGAETIILAFVLAMFAWLGSALGPRPFWKRSRETRRRQRAA